jgi:hypothetical protein
MFCSGESELIVEDRLSLLRREVLGELRRSRNAQDEL